MTILKTTLERIEKLSDLIAQAKLKWADIGVNANN